MPRKKSKNTDEIIYASIRVPAHIIQRIDELASELGLSRNQMILNLLTVSLEDAQLIKKLGLFKLNRVLKTFNLSDADLQAIFGVKNET